MIITESKKGEPQEAMMYRFFRKVRRRGLVKEVKGRNFHQATPSRNMQRKQALDRNKRSEEREYLIKIGKIPEFQPRGRRR